MREGLEEWRQAGNFHMSSYLANFADCLMRAGRGDDAEPIVGEAEAIAAATDEHSQFGKVLRLRGLLHQLKGHYKLARRSLLQSIDWSQSRKAKALELRSAIDLVRLGFRLEDTADDLEALRSIVAWFPEALNYPDLQEARQLIADKS
jgi:predicted ATPase